MMDRPTRFTCMCIWGILIPIPDFLLTDEKTNVFIGLERKRYHHLRIHDVNVS